jgi:hypothetical protein
VNAKRSTAKTTIWRLALAGAAVLLLAGCGEQDPGPSAVGGGSLSAEGQRQEYVDGVSRALSQLGSATQGQQFARAVDTGNRRQLQVAALAWQQGGAQLKGLNPPKDAVEGHKALVAAVEGLDAWNQRIVRAAPNKAATKKLARQASASPASQQFEAAVCQLVDAGFEVVDPGACTPLSNAEGPVG